MGGKSRKHIKGNEKIFKHLLFLCKFDLLLSKGGRNFCNSRSQQCIYESVDIDF